MNMPTSTVTGLTLKDLVDAGLHFGHQTKRWNPKMKSYIFDKRNGIHIIDLVQSIQLIDEAAEFLRDIVLSGKKVLFVATKKQAQEVMKNAAVACDQFYMTERWLGGTLTNNVTIRRSVRRMRQIEAIGRNNNGILSPHKKEASMLRRELDRLQKNLSGVADMDGKPGALFIIDVVREQNAVKEALKLNIPIVALVDTNADPEPIDKVVPGNDDAVRGIKLIAEAFAAVMKKASDEYAAVAAEKRKKEEEERAKNAAEDRAARKARRESGARAPRGNKESAAKAALAATRKRAAQAAGEAISAQAAAVEPAPAAPAAETEAPAAE